LDTDSDHVSEKVPLRVIDTVRVSVSVFDSVMLMVLDGESDSVGMSVRVKVGLVEMVSPSVAVSVMTFDSECVGDKEMVGETVSLSDQLIVVDSV
jgi:hypothetical protein